MAKSNCATFDVDMIVAICRMVDVGAHSALCTSRLVALGEAPWSKRGSRARSRRGRRQDGGKVGRMLARGLEEGVVRRMKNPVDCRR